MFVSPLGNLFSYSVIIIIVWLQRLIQHSHKNPPHLSASSVRVRLLPFIPAQISLVALNPLYVLQLVPIWSKMVVIAFDLLPLLDFTWIEPHESRARETDKRSVHHRHCYLNRLLIVFACEDIASSLQSHHRLQLALALARHPISRQPARDWQGFNSHTPPTSISHTACFRISQLVTHYQSNTEYTH